MTCIRIEKKLINLAKISVESISSNVDNSSIFIGAKLLVFSAIVRIEYSILPNRVLN